LKAEAPSNIWFMVVTFPVFQVVTSPLKAVASLNISRMLVT
jgi:hypothetical protein